MQNESKQYALRWKIFFFSIIAAVNLIIYYPSLFHIPRGDQWCYLADTAQYDDWFSLVSKFYSYNRVRLFNQGDALLFRPLTFILLGTEKWAFGNNFIYWQSVGIVLHLVLIWYLLNLSLRISNGILTPIAVMFFSTLAVIQEMVIWHHINGYIFFSIFILGALNNVYSLASEKRKERRRLCLIAVYLTLACFTYELGIAFTVLLAIYLLVAYDRSKQFLSRKWIALFLIPVVLYLLVNGIDYSLHSPKNALSQQGLVSKGIFSDSSAGDVIAGSFKLTLSYIYAGLFPLLLEVIINNDGKLCSTIPVCKSFLKLPFLSDLSGFISLITLAMLLLILVAAMLLLLKRKTLGSANPQRSFFHSERLAFVMFLVASFFVSIMIVSITRGKSVFSFEVRPDSLTFNMYHSYIPWIFLVLIMCLLFEAVKSRNYFFRGFRINQEHMIKFTLILLIAINGYKVFTVNQKMAKLFEPTRLYIESVNSFISVHRKEPDFSFAFERYPEEDGYLWFIGKAGESPYKKLYYMSDVLFQKYLAQTSPKYLFRYRGAEENTSVFRSDKWYLL